MTAVEQISEALRTAVAHGDYPPGDRLPSERELAERLGVSRPAVREAIGQLVEGGVLESRRGSGTYVAAVDVEDVFAVRLRLEPLAAGLAATQRTAGATKEMRELLGALRASLADARRFAAVDVELHRAIAAASGNPVLIGILARLTDLTMLSRDVSSTAAAARRSTLADMRAVVGAIRASDPEGAEKAMARHLATVQEFAREAPPAARPEPVLRRVGS